MENNLLIQGDNLAVMEWMLANGFRNSVDLVYVDPPFATNGTFGISNGRASTISRARNAQTAYTDRIRGVQFVDFIRQRLVLARELLSTRGSLYLHTDCKIGPYLRVMMDEVFGEENFRGEITRIKCNPKNFPRIGYGNVKDSILFYSSGQTPIWHEPHEEYSDKDIARLFPKKDRSGRRYTTVPIHAPGETITAKPFKGRMPPTGRHWRTDVSILEKWDAEGRIEWSDSGNPRKIVYADERPGKRVQDVWTDFKDPMYPAYPTEKNAAMLDLIIRTSSDPGSIVMDFFCGSGTTAAAAARAGRRWIAIDESNAAISAARKKLGFDCIDPATDSAFLDFRLGPPDRADGFSIHARKLEDSGQMLLAMEKDHDSIRKRRLKKRTA